MVDSPDHTIMVRGGTLWLTVLITLVLGGMAHYGGQS